jgi:hypothetical protein
MSEENLPVESTKDLDLDYEYARERYYSLIERGDEAIEVMLEFIKETESPRAMEVFSNMLKQNAEIADRLLELQKKKQDIEIGKKQKSSDDVGGLTQNNVFIGSTSELQRFLRNQEKEISND